MKNKLKYFGLTLACSAVLFSFTASDELFSISKNLGIFTSLYKEVNQSYVDEVEPAQLMKDALTQMLKDLDPYTNYYSDAVVEGAKLERFASGGNIGVELMEQDGKIIVKSTLADLPADKAAIRPGDEILKIDGKPVVDKKIEEIDIALKGQPDSPLSMTVKSFSTQKEDVRVMYRETIEPKDVTFHQMLNDTVGYVRLATFNARGCGQFIASAITELKGDGAKFLIFDLRGNLGGLLNEAVAICNLFVPKDVEVVTSKGRFKQYEKSYVTKADPLVPDMPVAVLINGRSASASEIVSGTLQDLDRAVVMGNLSYGKGLVQQTKDLPFGAKMKLTIAKYFLPTGRCIQAVDYYGDYTDKGATKIADSLKTAFTTPNGRTVYDNNGVAPDIEIELTKNSTFVDALIEQQLIFNYVNTFQSKNDSILTAEEFEFTDADFTDFERFVDKSSFKFVSETQETFNDLEKSLEEDKVSAAFKTQLAALQTRIEAEEKGRLKSSKSELKKLLKYEIIDRYHHERGRVVASLSDDPHILEAYDLFGDMDRYFEILGY